MARLYTNENFPRPAAHAGIIVCTFDPDFTGQAHRIDQAWRDRSR
ncbi:MAG TPA: hypothetical protein VEW48_15700 [Thermoanaerobaculia bacterium]|nr:hypothetical protein [Thermoanaerobaculia bacterium]